MERYDRHFQISDFKQKDQDALVKASVLVIGAGGLGSPILQYLFGAGIGQITIFDADIITKSNLPRQILYHEADIGQLKVDKVLEKAILMNAEIDVVARAETFDSNTIIDQDIDLIIASPDNYTCRLDADLFAERNNIPIIHGAVQEYSGYWLRLDSDSRLRYKDIFPEQIKTSEKSKGILGPVAGIVGSSMAMEAIQYLRNKSVSKAYMCTIDTRTYRQEKIEIS
ncbi:ThiF family adenylyltransferase [Prolixibacteraceae bacterium]|uniref:HesA/MoeB/ThiF family protein n=1 Tax=Halosquirtibacter xylanolyticus TaxID=3374599 RepID=UPI003748F365|nr:ThiF family adenylyltransferase [Prolixibacteraceae bacterium]QZT37704.1 ThiF family adenylyltransferase [Prolixibacteraceae bacterium]